MTVFAILDYGLMRTDTTFVHTELPYHGRQKLRVRARKMHPLGCFGPGNFPFSQFGMPQMISGTFRDLPDVCHRVPKFHLIVPLKFSVTKITH